MVFVALLLCVVVSMEMISGVSASIDMNRSRKSVYTVKGRVPIIFANNQKNISSSNSRRNRLRRSSSGLMDYGNGNNREIDDVATVSSRSYTKYYSSNAYDDGYDDINEWDRLERIKKDLQSKLGGYRPWSVDTSSTRPGTYSWTTKLVLANVAFYALQMISPSITRFGAKRSELIMQGKELHRLITPVFLHGSVTHLMLNTFSLQNIGPEVERLFGGGRFLSTYLAAGVAGNLVSAYYSPNPSLGASGAVFGLMGAYYAFLSQNERILGRSGQNAMSRVSGTLAMNVLFGLSSPRIDNWAHIGGALGGATMAAAFGPKLSLLGLPNGGSIIVDKPSVRLPPSIESIPTNISKRFRRAKLRMQVDRYVSELTAKPWRKNRGRQKRFRMKKGPIRPRFEE
eukprot:CAMPEP_0203677934 /NCGR_PEP_ID=MMETSP0090-20130426/30054_1 /ASSEMBLY_ACC=CAM_ASM_001088 /TAXON_ID=426623 /ORGANISM="Chaetoceros affinis, Strain CCMP159" /LENGTH=398 /DNA_ID=CAMNT_0050544981 /DNA_START=38 /DNA_END=1234 /DNA_ORIENTATION=-